MLTNTQVCGRVSSVLSFFAILALITMLVVSPAFSQSAPIRVTRPIDESNIVKLAGNTRPEANAKNDRGPLPDGYDIDHILLVLQRSPEQEKELATLIDSLNDRNSPNFHHWLTPEEFGKYGVAQEDIDKVTGWLESHGFRINTVYANHMMIDFSGPAGSLRQAFHADMHYIEVGGQAHIANMGDPWVPAALAPVVKGVFSLNDFKPHPMYKVRPDYTFAGCPTSTFPTWPGTCYAITPQDNAVIYNLNPLWAAGYSGQGQTIALVEDTDTYGTAGSNGASDWNTYRSTFGLSSSFPLGSYSMVHPGGCADPGTNGDDGEAAIDVEVASAMAPSAAIELISCKSSSTTFGGQIALQNLINASGPYPGVVSVSYGECEALNGSGGNATFNNTYEQAAAQGISVFVSAGDEGPSSCSNEFSVGEDYDVTSLGVTGWGETPYNVTVGGTDFEDIYNSMTNQNGGAALSTYWSATNSPSYGSALSYIPEMPWNDACADVLISEAVTGSYLTYGTSGMCNNSNYDTPATYLSTGTGSGGASNCATGAAGTNQSSYLISAPNCQGYAKPSWQSGASLAGGQAVYGVPNDGVRDIPDVSMFAANGIWTHYEIVCWSDPNETRGGSEPCTGAPDTWAGFGGTSVSSPTMAGIQALINQKTGESWGNPNPLYYQIGQNQYGTSGGTFLGNGCNSSTGNTAGCPFNDITQGDIDLACEDNGNVESAHCYLPSGTYGVDSTDNVTSATVINGGTGYTSAPSCSIAGPTNSNAYTSPTGTTLWAGGTQATCSASVTAGTTNAVWTVSLISGPSATTWPGMEIIVGGTTYTFVTGTPTAANQVELSTSSSRTTNETNTAKNLEAVINDNSAQCATAGCVYSGQTANASATATESTNVVTLTAINPGYAGNFNVSWGVGTVGNVSNAEFISIANTSEGQGPNYVSSITIGSAGSGYQPETPLTLTGGGGSGAIAVANTSPTTAAQSYQPAYGAAPGYDLATGLGSPNAASLVCNSAWGSECSTITVVTSSLNPSIYGQSVSFTATVAGVGPTGTVQFNIDGSAFGSPVAVSSGAATSGSINTLTVGTHTVTAAYSGDTNNQGSMGTLTGGQVVQTAGAGTITVASGQNPSFYGQQVTFIATIPGQYGLIKHNGQKGGPEIVTGTVTWSPNTGCGTTNVTSGNPGTATCITSIVPAGNNTVTANYSGDSNHNPGSGSTNQQVNQASTTINVTNVSPVSEDYGADSPVTITAVLSWAGGGTAPTAANVTISGNGPSTYGATNCGSPSGNTITCMATYTPTPADGAGTYTENATFSGDANYTSSSSPQTNNFTINAATTMTAVGSGQNPSTYSQPVTFTATITAENGFVKGNASRRMNRTGKPMDVTGTVAWSSNTGCGTTSVTGGTNGNPGTATCTTSSLNAGSNQTVTGTYSGDANHSGSSGSVSQTVNQASQTIAFTINAPSSAVYNTSFTVAATGGASGNPVTFTSSGSCSNSGATYTMTSGTGTCSVIANQAGNSNYSAAQQVTESVTAVKANPTVSFTGLPSSTPYNTAYMLVATTNASTTAVLSNNSPTKCSLTGSTVTIVASSGTCSVTANWAADNNYNSATATQSSTVTKGVAVISWATPGAITYGTPLSGTQLDSTATPSNVYTTAVYSPSSGKVLDVGSQTLKVTYAPHGNSNYATSTDEVTLQVEQAPTSTTNTPVDSTVTLGRNGTVNDTIDFTVSSYKPTGTVQVTASGPGTIFCQGPVGPSTGKGSCKLTFSQAGTWTVTASYPGDANHTGSTSTGTTVTVNP